MALQEEMREGFRGGLFDAEPAMQSSLDPDFRPLVLGLRAYRRALARFGASQPIRIGLEGEGGASDRLDLEVFPIGSGHEGDSLNYLRAMTDLLLWSRGGWRLSLAGPEGYCHSLAADFAAGGSRRFSATVMGRAFDHPFEVRCVSMEEIPETSLPERDLGGHWEGCRLGFDLGASDLKVAALREGEVVFQAEWPWEPATHGDPSYHARRLEDALMTAAGHLPRVDAIGGSTAGILVEGELRVSSLFRAVAPERYRERVHPFFQRLQANWEVPWAVANDGDAAALAGARLLGRGGVLGLSIGTSLAAGYVSTSGQLRGWINELAFAPLDANPGALTDEWSGRPGTGGACLSQLTALKRAERGGMTFPEKLSRPERLERLMELASLRDPTAVAVFESLGNGLGYSIPLLCEFYDPWAVLILGRVVTGMAGEILVARAREILDTEFPELAARLHLELPGAALRRGAQAIAAASLPNLHGSKTPEALH